MPQDGAKLSDAEIAHVAAWIDRGSPYDKPLVDTSAPQTDWRETKVPDSARSFWSFQPLARVEPPAVKNEPWVRTPIDRFILAKLEEKGLAPRLVADKRKLIRRAYFDLIGLPPTPEQVRAFLDDTSPQAFERVIEQLLKSPHHGERWARHWLDVARFAESHGFEQDYDRPHAYHYRDFVIRALNADMPYLQFVRWQLAGDELAPDDPLALAATGFLGAGVFPTQITANEVERTRYDALDDMLSTVGTAMLGLTVGCARCHDHKFDPIPQGDYYRMLSTFTTTVRSDQEVNLDLAAYRPLKAEFDKKHAPLVGALAKFEADELPRRVEAWEKSRPTDVPGEIAAILGEPRDKRTAAEQAQVAVWYRLSDPQWQTLNKAVTDDAAKAPKAKLVKMMVCSEGVTPIRHHTQGADFFNETHYLKRGDTDSKLGIAPQGFLQVLLKSPDDANRWPAKPPEAARTSYRRAAMAAWLTDTEHGAGQLLARVIVNRMWQHHFGRGIVATPNDFGNQGTRPMHPELLDYLAGELIKSGWRLHAMHRLMMASAVYMQSTSYDEAAAKIDPENTLYWRRTPRRLEAEAIRDAMLVASGTLDPTMFGPGSLEESHVRRSIYFTIKRSRLIPIMQLFDQPEPLVSIGQRSATTIAPQALAIMNNPHVRRYALSLGKKLSAAAPDSMSAIRLAYDIALSRPASDAELTDAAAFIAEQTRAYTAANKTDAQHLALGDFCQVLFGLNEFVFIE
jgi:hypothetical protein